MIVKSHKFIVAILAATLLILSSGAVMAGGSFRYAKTRVIKANKFKKAKRTKSTPSFQGVRVVIMPLNEAAGEFDAIKLDIAESRVRGSNSVGDLVSELRALGSSNEFEGINECLSDSDDELSRSEFERILDGEESDSCIQENFDVEQAGGEGIAGLNVPADMSDFSRISNCLIQNRQDVRQLAGISSCMGRPESRFRPENIIKTVSTINGGESRTINNNPLEHVMDGFSIVPGVVIDDTGRVGHGGCASSGNLGGCGGFIPQRGGGVYVYGGPTGGAQHGIVINSPDSSSNSSGTNVSEGQRALDVVTRAIEDERQRQAEKEEANETKEPEWEEDSEEEGEEENSCAGREGEAGTECEDATIEPDLDDDSTKIPADPEGGSAISEECQQEELEEGAERGELPDNLGPLIIPPEDSNGAMPAYLTCIIEVIAPPMHRDCELDQVGMPTEPGGGSLCDSAVGSGFMIEADFNGDAGRTDPDDSPVGGVGGDINRPECENPSDPGCEEQSF